MFRARPGRSGDADDRQPERRGRGRRHRRGDRLDRFDPGVRRTEHRRDLYYAARALDNGIYVVFSGLTGTCGDYAFNGGSAVYDPEGRPVDRVGDEAPAIAYADLDPAEVTRVQAMNPIGRDRLTGLGSRQRQVLAG